MDQTRTMMQLPMGPRSFNLPFKPARSPSPPTLTPSPVPSTPSKPTRRLPLSPSPSKLTLSPVPSTPSKPTRRLPSSPSPSELAPSPLPSTLSSSSLTQPPSKPTRRPAPSPGTSSPTLSPAPSGLSLSQPPSKPTLSLSITKPTLSTSRTKPTLSLSTTKPTLPVSGTKPTLALSQPNQLESHATGPSLQVNPTPEERTISLSIIAAPKSTKTFDGLRTLVKTGLDDLKISSLSPSREYFDNDFEELNRLGEGADGAVHKVRDKRTGVVVARKTIATRDATMNPLQWELTTAASVEHRNIAKWYGTYTPPSTGEIKIIMEYCEGGSLESISKRIKDRGAVVGEKVAGRLAEGILQGLAYLHAKKMTHRDIQPSNILLSREGVVKLCNFARSSRLVDSLSGTFTGSCLYMAPERLCGHEYTIRSDVWSTGISLLELVQNRFPFPDDLCAIDLMMYITTEEPPRLEDDADVQWSDGMKDFVKEMLIVDAVTRPTPKDMLSHPWILDAMKQEVHMARWVRQVWGWPKLSRRSRDAITGAALQ